MTPHSIHTGILLAVGLLALFDNCNNVMTDPNLKAAVVEADMTPSHSSLTAADKSDPSTYNTPPKTPESATTTINRMSTGSKDDQRKLKQLQSHDPNRDILLVHVGKTGGKTIRANLAVHCVETFRLSNPATAPKVMEARANCFQKFPREEQPLANQTRDFIHMWRVDKTAGEVANATSYLVLLRNPIERVISAYRYAHPANCKRGKGAGCAFLDQQGNFLPVRHGRDSPAKLLFGDCFPSAGVEDLAQAVLPLYTGNQHFESRNYTSEKECQCRKFGRTNVQGYPNTDHIKGYPYTNQKGIAFHFHYNYRFYAEASYYKNPEKEVFAIRTEHEYEDMQSLDVLLGGNGTFRNPNRHHSHGSEKYLPSPISEIGYQKLCCVLEDEIAIYFDTIQKALNLKTTDYEEAESILRQKCGLEQEETWADWRTKCKAVLAKPPNC